MKPQDFLAILEGIAQAALGGQPFTYSLQTPAEKLGPVALGNLGSYEVDVAASSVSLTFRKVG